MKGENKKRELDDIIIKLSGSAVPMGFDLY
jgi:hypothetical protein